MCNGTNYYVTKMPFTVHKTKHVIKVLRQEKQYIVRRFLTEFPNENWSRRGLDGLIKKTVLVRNRFLM